MCVLCSFVDITWLRAFVSYVIKEERETVTCDDLDVQWEKLLYSNGVIPLDKLCVRRNFDSSQAENVIGAARRFQGLSKIIP